MYYKTEKIFAMKADNREIKCSLKSEASVGNAVRADS